MKEINRLLNDAGYYQEKPGKNKPWYKKIDQTRCIEANTIELFQNVLKDAIQSYGGYSAEEAETSADVRWWQAWIRDAQSAHATWAGMMIRRGYK
jgi:hypothetical protein